MYTGISWFIFAVDILIILLIIVKLILSKDDDQYDGNIEELAKLLDSDDDEESILETNDKVDQISGDRTEYVELSSGTGETDN